MPRTKKTNVAQLPLPVSAPAKLTPVAAPVSKASTVTEAEAILRPLLAHLDREEFWVIALDERMNVLGVECVAKGGAAFCPVDPKILFGTLLRIPRTTGCIIAHNHPSNDPTPSNADWALTEQLVKGGTILCLRVYDHVIITDTASKSMRSQCAQKFEQHNDRVGYAANR